MVSFVRIPFNNTIGYCLVQVAFLAYFYGCFSTDDGGNEDDGIGSLTLPAGFLHSVAALGHRAFLASTK